MCHQRHNGQGLTGRLDIGCGSPAALPRGPRRKVQSAECAKELAAGEQEATPSLPASVYDKGPVAPTPFSQEGGGFRFIARCLRFVCPVVSHQNTFRTTPCVSQAQPMPARSGTTGVWLGVLLPAHPTRLPV